MNKIEHSLVIDSLGYIQEIHIKYKNKDYCDLKVRKNGLSYTDCIIKLFNELLNEHFSDYSIIRYNLSCNYDLHDEVESYLNEIILNNNEKFKLITFKLMGDISELLQNIIDSIEKSIKKVKVPKFYYNYVIHKLLNIKEFYNKIDIYIKYKNNNSFVLFKIIDKKDNINFKLKLDINKILSGNQLFLIWFKRNFNIKNHIEYECLYQGIIYQRQFKYLHFTNGFLTYEEIVKFCNENNFKLFERYDLDKCKMIRLLDFTQICTDCAYPTNTKHITLNEVFEYDYKLAEYFIIPSGKKYNRILVWIE